MSAKVRNLLCVLLAVLFALGGVLLVNVLLDSEPDNKVSKQQSEIPKASGKTYYVDAAAKEGNDGLSPEKAFKTLEEVNNMELEPGDLVLFKRDCVWNGGLVIRYSGTAEEPIVYDVYGDGVNLPRINGNGQLNATVYGADISYVEIRNLEVTNESDRTKSLRGIFINAVEQNVEGVKILNCYVHDVDSQIDKYENTINSTYSDEHWNGGIIVRAGSGKKNGETILKDVIVKGNRVEQCSLVGISIGGIFHTLEPERKSQGVKVVDNYVKECFGDGIIMFNCDGGLIEGNVSDHNGAGNRADLFFVGIWTIWSDNTLIQYNESFGQGESGDGQGFDVDGSCNNTIVQYNYSHDNYGGFLLLMENNNGRTTVRYNVSQNDGGGFLKLVIRKAETSFINADIYNNTYYTNKTIGSLISFEKEEIPDGRRLLATFKNNIFCSVGGMEAPVFSGETDAQYFTFESNCWYGFMENKLPQNESNQIVANPKLSYGGSGSKGTASLNGYMLLGDSPCLNTGIVVHNNGGLDFWGNELKDTVNIGAYDGASVKKPIDANIALSSAVTMSSVKALPIMRDTMMGKVVDGLKDDVISTKPTEYVEEAWFEIDFGEEYEINKVIITPGEENNQFPKSFTIDVWDGKAWKTVVEEKNYKLPKNDTDIEFKLDTEEGSKIRIHVTDMHVDEAGMYSAGLAEIEVYQ